MREGSEVRDLKAWLYRVVHNTAVNAMRDSAHDGEPLADPTLGSSIPPAHRRLAVRPRLAMRETLAEVAALPPLQREVIVRTAVGGDSHEQVASDLGITNGAVRGLLYRARTTLRTGITALTPPPLLGWLVGRSDQGGPAPERLAELAGGGGAVGVGGAAGVSGLLLKGGAAALTVGTVITGAAVVHLSASTPHRPAQADRRGGAPEWCRCGLYGGGACGGQLRRYLGHRCGRASRCLRSPGRAPRGLRRREDPRDAQCRRRGLTGAPTASGGDHAPRSTTRVTGDAHNNARRRHQLAEPGARLDPGVRPDRRGSGAGSSQSGDRVGRGIGLGLGRPVGSAAGNGSRAAPKASTESNAGGSSEGGASGGGQSGSGSGVGSGSGSGSESGAGNSEGSGSGGSSGGSSGSSGSESSGGEQSGSLVGTVVHEVGSVLEHLLH